MSAWIPPAHVACAATIVVWDVMTAGRIAQYRQATRAFALISGLAGFLIAPAALIGVATATSLAGGAALRVDWLWPAAIVLCTAQAVYASVRRLVNPILGVPIVLYDLAITLAELTRYAVAHGVGLSHPVLATLAAQRGAFALVISPVALASPVFFLPPAIAPAFPALGRLAAVVRVGVASLAAAWLALGVAEYPVAYAALRSYARHATAPLRKRPDRDLAIGLALFPAIGPVPEPAGLRNDIGLADSLIVDAVAVVVTPSASVLALDSVTRAVEQMRRDSTRLIVTLAADDALFPALRDAPPPQERGVDALLRVVRRMHPDIVLVPVDSRVPAGRRAADFAASGWREYLTRVARVAKHDDVRLRVGVSLSHFDAVDSAVYAWAVRPGSPIDVVGISLLPSRRGALAIDLTTSTVDRWMLALLPATEHWVFTGGYPLAHGERSQENGIWAAIAWATDRPLVKGVIVVTSGDYGETTGLRSPFGRLRLATYAITRAIRGLREPVAP
jgi:hypothetical protein